MRPKLSEFTLYNNFFIRFLQHCNVQDKKVYNRGNRGMFLCKNSSVLIKIILNDNPEKSKLLLTLAALLGQLVGIWKGHIYFKMV